MRLVLFDDAEFPPLLKEIHDPPFGIYIRSGENFDIAILRDCDMASVRNPEMSESRNIPLLAIVGTRRGTPDGKSTASRFARELAGAGFGIVSGLAFGVDAAAHVGCLDAKGITIAVLAGGLDEIYPRTNERLAERILANGGCIISEYPFGSPPLPYRFLERNRLVSGISKGVLVVESPARSGSLATARFALEQNRDVFVIPGPITHPNFFGSHELIRQGAELVTKPEDILASYGIERTMIMTNDDNPDTEEEKLILQALRANTGPLDVDKIISLTKLEPRIANQTITFLLLNGLIKETERGYTI
jgi:DNA processing protein